jgi:hypothetical protein
MPVSRVFLKPRSVELPSQGDYEFVPLVRVYEADSAANLESQLNAEFGVQSTSTTEFYVIEDIEYQVRYKPAPMAEWRYSALVWATKVRIV